MFFHVFVYFVYFNAYFTWSVSLDSAKADIG